MKCKEHLRLSGKLHVTVQGVTDLALCWPNSTLKAHQGLDLGFWSWTAEKAHLHTQPPTLHLFCFSCPVHFSFSSPGKGYDPHPPCQWRFCYGPKLSGINAFLRKSLPCALVPALQLNLCGLKSGSSDYSNFWSFSFCDLQICPS